MSPYRNGGQFVVQRSCGRCSKLLVNMFKCGSCNMMPYCSAACQLEDWPSHSHDCDMNLRYQLKLFNTTTIRVGPGPSSSPTAPDGSTLVLAEYISHKVDASGELVVTSTREASMAQGIQPYSNLGLVVCVQGGGTTATSPPCVLLVRIAPVSFLHAAFGGFRATTERELRGGTPTWATWRARAMRVMLAGQCGLDVPVRELGAYELRRIKKGDRTFAAGGRVCALATGGGNVVSATCIACGVPLAPDADAAIGCGECRFARFCDDRCMGLGARRELVSLRLGVSSLGRVRARLCVYRAHDAAACASLATCFQCCPRPGQPIGWSPVGKLASSAPADYTHT